MPRTFTWFLVCLFVVSLSSAIAQPTVIFHDDFEEGAFKPEWELLPAQENGVIEVFPSKMLHGEYVARLGKSVDGDFSLNKLDLHLDLSAYQDVELKVSIAHNYDDPHVQDGIYLSDDGRNFVKVLGFTYDRWLPDMPGTLPPLNLRELAARHRLSLTDQFVIRFQQYDDHDFTGGAEFSDGLYLDDVVVQTVANDYASLPFFDDFKGPSFSRYWAVGDPAITNPSEKIGLGGITDIFLTDDTIQQQVARLGSSVDRDWVTNALDLRLNLQDQQDVVLTFKIYNNHDESHPQDGLFFSDNGGQHFTKVYDFDLDQWEAQLFGQLPPLSVDQLASQHGLSLTDRFVVRFQQYDDDDFEGSRLTSDGYYLDDVRVETRHTEYASLPFVENFESATLKPYWQWNAPRYKDMRTDIRPNGIVETVYFDSIMGQVMMMGSSTDRSYVTNALDLFIDLGEAEAPSLSFRIYDNHDETDPQDGIYFSDNGGKEFKKVYHFDGDRWGSKAFGMRYALDIKKLATAAQLKLTSTFVIRFQQHDDDDFEGTRTISDGIYLDDIRIAEPARDYLSALPFTEGFEVDSLSAHWQYADLKATAPPEMFLPDGDAHLVNWLSHTGNRALILGKRTDGHPTVSALDLCLNLAYQKKLELSFWLYNNYDDQDPEDGIWFSNDGGNSFKKAYTFNYDNPGKYEFFNLNVDSLLLETQQNYSDRFVIRFQQRGNRRIDGEGIFRHGLVLDDIMITSPLLSPEVSNAAKPEESPDR